MNKLRIQAVISICLLLILVLGGSSMFYFLFATDYYIGKKQTLMDAAFSNLQKLNLRQISYDDDPSINSLEAESFFIIICDESFNQIYSSKLGTPDNLIADTMKPAKERFTEDARAVYYDDVSRRPIALYGLIRKDHQVYYIYIYEYTTGLRRSIRYMNNFLADVLILTIVAGSGFAWIICSKIVKPIQNISTVAEKMSENDFSVRASESIPTYELKHLARNINHMADKIQKDMSDLNNYNYLLLRQNQNMAELEDMRKEIVRKVTHELKTPLAIISSQVEMLQYEYDNSKKDYYFSSIMEEIEKMSGLISNVLHSALIEEALPSTLMARDNVSLLLETLVPKYEIWMRTSKIAFKTLIQEDCYAVFDASQLEQAINNYIMNAYRHTLPQSQIILTLRQDEESIYCSVYNEGEAIPKEEQSRIWKSFYQGKNKDEKNSAKPNEIGLGLYIVKDIINLHKGTCGVFNCRKGVEFWFRLPKA